MQFTFLGHIRFKTTLDFKYGFGLSWAIKFKISIYLWLVKLLERLIQEIRKRIFYIFFLLYFKFQKIVFNKFKILFISKFVFDCQENFCNILKSWLSLN